MAQRFLRTGFHPARKGERAVLSPRAIRPARARARRRTAVRAAFPKSPRPRAGGPATTPEIPRLGPVVPRQARKVPRVPGAAWNVPTDSRAGFGNAPAVPPWTQRVPANSRGVPAIPRAFPRIPSVFPRLPGAASVVPKQFRVRYLGQSILSLSVKL